MSEAALRAFPATLQLAGWTMSLSIVGAVAIGSLAAYRPNSAMDRVASLLSSTAASVPDFWFAIMGVLVFAVSLGWLPTSGTSGAAAWVLPVATLFIRPFGVLVQVVRGAMITALSAPYVKVARSKGASEARVVFGHALRNAAAPALTVAGDLAVGLVNGAVVVETVFGWPGIGKLMIDSVLQRDFAVLQAAVLLTALVIFALNILVDLCHALLDPRVRQPHGGMSRGRDMLRKADGTAARRNWLAPLLRDRFAFAAALVLVMVALCAVLGPLLADDLATRQNLRAPGRAPFSLDHGWAFVLGSDSW